MVSILFRVKCYGYCNVAWEFYMIQHSLKVWLRPSVDAFTALLLHELFHQDFNMIQQQNKYEKKKKEYL